MKQIKSILKIIGVALGVILLVLAAAATYFYFRFHPAKTFTWGLDFSQEEARALGFDPRIMLLDILTDLKPKEIRLPAYWNEIEPSPGKYDFTEIDDYLNLANQYHAQVILALGRKLPRWPECFAPDWAKQLPVDQMHQAQLDMLNAAIDHFKSFPAITTWQVENEPLFGFGDDCTKIGASFLTQEIATVKSIDSSRPVLATDSGELGRWLPTALTGPDEFGSTMYRVVHDPTFGYFKYPLPPAFFRIKAGLIETFAHPKEILGVELQAEPWFADGIENTDLATQRALMNPKIFAANIAYAEQVGFSQNYLWGVEWWYWMAKTQNDWGMWTAAKELLAK